MPRPDDVYEWRQNRFSARGCAIRLKMWYQTEFWKIKIKGRRSTDSSKYFFLKKKEAYLWNTYSRWNEFTKKKKNGLPSAEITTATATTTKKKKKMKFIMKCQKKNVLFMWFIWTENEKRRDALSFYYYYYLFISHSVCAGSPLPTTWLKSLPLLLLIQLSFDSISFFSSSSSL